LCARQDGMADAPTPKPRIDKFRDLARALETDDDEAAFDARLKKLAKAARREQATGTVQIPRSNVKRVTVVQAAPKPKAPAKPK
jgi:hypothetical protein